jgi:hypothetical protein
MGRLFGVELSRIYHRRLVRVFVILAMAGASLIGIVYFFQSNSSDQQVRATLSQRETDLARCLDGEFGEPPPGESLETYCDEEAVAIEGYDDRSRFTEFEDVIIGVSIMIVILGWVTGASAVGAEWHTRNMTTLLTWESRRIRVLVTKLVAAIVMAFAISMFLQLWLVGTLTPAVLLRGTTDGGTMDWFLDLLELMARVGFIAAVSAGFGASLAFIGRNTAAALGAGFAYLAIVEGLIRGLKPAWQKWLIGDNAAIVIGGESQNLISGRSVASAAALITIYIIILGAAAGTFFKTRDVP